MVQLASFIVINDGLQTTAIGFTLHVKPELEKPHCFQQCVNHIKEFGILLLPVHSSVKSQLSVLQLILAFICIKFFPRSSDVMYQRIIVYLYPTFDILINFKG